MSYILEALKKSELEREQLDLSLPDDGLSSMAKASAPGSSSVNLAQSPLKVIYLLVVVVLASVLAFLLLKPVASSPIVAPDFEVSETFVPSLLGNKQILDEANVLTGAKSETAVILAADPMTAISVVEVAVAKIETSHIANADAQETKLIVPKMTEPEDVEGIVVDKEVVAKKEIVIEEKPEVLSIEQANESLLAQIPNISITSHIYSSQAKRRSIVVNDERLVEGDFVAAKVQVKEITHQGMILEVNGSLLAVSRSRGWNH